MKNLRTFEEFVNENALAKPKKFKKKTGPLTIQADANDVEIDASAVWGQFAEGPMYIYPNDEGWDNMLDTETDKNAKKNLKILMAALKKCLSPKGDIIADDKAIKNLDNTMDNLDNMGWENSGGHFFGGEMYNGWQYDDHGTGNTTDAMIASALYAYAKIETFLWWKTENKKNESVNENKTWMTTVSIKDALKKGKVNVGSMVDVDTSSNNKELPKGQYAIMPFTDDGDYWNAGDLKKFADKVIDDLNKNYKGKVELIKIDTGKSIRSYIVAIDESVNERIELTSGLETVDNFGKVDTFGPKEILKILQDPETWTDDQQFMDKAGNVYHIDDLLNKEVKVGGKVFTIVEN